MILRLRNPAYISFPSTKKDRSSLPERSTARFSAAITHGGGLVIFLKKYNESNDPSRFYSCVQLDDPLDLERLGRLCIAASEAMMRLTSED